MLLPRRQLDALETVAWGMDHFGAILTGRGIRLRVVRALMRKGYVESAGSVAVCDGDGFMVQPERWREGFRLTESGIQAAAQSGSINAKNIQKRLNNARNNETLLALLPAPAKGSR